MKEILGWLGGGAVLLFTWIFSYMRISSLKAKNKKLEKERDWEEKAKNSKIQESSQLQDIDKKTDDEIFNNWKNEK